MRLRGTVLSWAVVVTSVLAAGLALCAPVADAATRIVRYHGQRLAVPASWPVFDLARSPRTCVRFNRHAVYLGVPSAEQRCPAHAVGRTGALLLEPLAARGAVAADAGLAHAVGLTGLQGEGAASVPLGRGLIAIATWGSDRRLLASVLGRPLGRRAVRASAGLAGRSAAPRASRTPIAVYGAPVASQAISPFRGVPASSGGRVGTLHSGRRPVADAASATYTGLGFDACAAPSAGVMSAWWEASPYRAIGVYVGGTNAACSQPNLTPAWVSSETLAGWHLIPTYVGLQGAGACGGTCATITRSQAAAEGTAAADDAITQVRALGIPEGNPVYDDMEAYNDPGPKGHNRAAVLAFLAAWTTELHAGGYLAGVYGSGTSVITDLVGEYGLGSGYPEPDDLWIAHWNGVQTTSDSYVPAADWAVHQRLHQYSGGQNQTYCGRTLNIDGDYLDGATAGAPSPYPDGTFVQVSGQTQVYRIAGGAPILWTLSTASQPIVALTAQQYAALPTVPADGTVVEGLPSATYWSFAGGVRTQLTAPVAGVTQVDDAGLQAFPVASQPSGGGGIGPAICTHPPAPSCVVPRLKHLSLVRARQALNRSHCKLGRVRRPRWPWRPHLLRVYGQSAPVASHHRSGYRVNIRLI